MLLGLAFGRIGCFMNGCCFGKQCSLPWGVQLPAGSPWPLKRRPSSASGFAARQHTSAGPPDAAFTGPLARAAGIFVHSAAYWPRRQYDGQCPALRLYFSGRDSLFEEALQALTTCRPSRKSIFDIDDHRAMVRDSDCAHGFCAAVLFPTAECADSSARVGALPQAQQ